MPNMDGFSFIEGVRASEKWRGVPILVLTTESDPEKKKRAKQAGATGWIIKPFNAAKLVDAVRSAAQIERLECVSGDPRRPASRRVSLPPASYYPARILPPPCRLWGNGISDKGFEQLSELVASHPGLRHLECVQSARLAHALPPFPT